MTVTAAIHVARKQLGLDDETARDVYVRVTGKRSLRAMSEGEKLRLVEHFRGQGFTPASKSASRAARRRLEGKYAPILQALWIAGWNLGVVRDRDDHALVAFVKRQAKVDHVRFLHDPADARSAIEGLKGWLAREAGVDWTVDRFMSDWTQTNGYRVATRQFAILKARGADLDGHQDLGRWATARFGDQAQLWRLDDAGWRDVMNALGILVRQKE